MAPFKLLKLATINSVFPILVFLPNAIALSSFVLQKTSFMGAQGQPSYTPFIADGVAGAVIGMVVISATGNLTPWIAYACGKGLKVYNLLPCCSPCKRQTTLPFFSAGLTALRCTDIQFLLLRMNFLQTVQHKDGPIRVENENTFGYSI